MAIHALPDLQVWEVVSVRRSDFEHRRFINGHSEKPIHSYFIDSDLQANHRKPLLPPEFLQTAESLFVPMSRPAPPPIRIRKCGEACGESGGIHPCPITGFEKTGVGDQPVVAPFGKVKPDATAPLLASRHPV